MSARSLTSNWIDNGFGYLVYSPCMDQRIAFAYENGGDCGFAFEYSAH